MKAKALGQANLPELLVFREKEVYRSGKKMGKGCRSRCSTKLEEGEGNLICRCSLKLDGRCGVSRNKE